MNYVPRIPAVRKSVARDARGDRLTGDKVDRDKVIGNISNLWREHVNTVHIVTRLQRGRLVNPAAFEDGSLCVFHVIKITKTGLAARTIYCEWKENEGRGGGHYEPSLAKSQARR